MRGCRLEYATVLTLIRSIFLLFRINHNTSVMLVTYLYILLQYFIFNNLCPNSSVRSGCRQAYINNVYLKFMLSICNCVTEITLVLHFMAYRCLTTLTTDCYIYPSIVSIPGSDDFTVNNGK